MMSEALRVYSPKPISNIDPLPSISNDTKLLGISAVQTGTFTVLNLAQHFNIDSFNADYAEVLSSITTINNNITSLSNDITTLQTDMSSRLAYTVNLGDTFIDSPSGNIVFNVGGDASVTLIEDGLSLAGSDVKFYVSSTSPEGVVSANKGSLVAQPSATDGNTVWYKSQGTSSTGWLPLTSSGLVNVKAFGAKGDTVYVPSTGEYTGTDDTSAIRNALATGQNVLFPKGLYTVTGELEVVTPGQVIVFENSGGYGYGSNSTALPSYLFNTAIIAKGTFSKRIRTRRQYRASSSDPQDTSLSVVWNIQADNVTLKNVSTFLYCDFSDTSNTNFGDDCDIAYFVGTRVGWKFEDCQALGYFRKAGFYIDVTNGANLPRFNNLAGSAYPAGTVKNSVDNGKLFNCYSRGPYRGLAILGALPKSGETTYTTAYYDEILGTTATDARGSMGAENVLSLGCCYYSVEHHSGRRVLNPQLDGGVLTQTSLLSEPDNAPAAVHIDGLADNANDALSNIRFINTVLASAEIFRVRLSHADKISFYSSKTDVLNGTLTDTSGSSIDTTDFDEISYGMISGTSNTTNVFIQDASQEDILDYKHFYGTNINILTNNGKILLDSSSYIQAHNGSLDLRSSTGNLVNIRNGSTVALKVATDGIAFGASGPKDFWGSGSPEGVVTAIVGSTYRRTDGSTGTSFYVKESGTGNTGWVAK